jgi:hypothetical protein
VLCVIVLLVATTQHMTHNSETVRFVLTSALCRQTHLVTDFVTNTLKVRCNDSEQKEEDNMYCDGCGKKIQFHGRWVNKRVFHNKQCWLLFCKGEEHESKPVSEMSHPTRSGAEVIRSNDKV